MLFPSHHHRRPGCLSRPGNLDPRKDRLYDGQHNTSPPNPQDRPKGIPLQRISAVPPEVRQPARLLTQAEPLEVDEAIAQPREVALGAVDVALQELLLLKVYTSHRPDAARQFVDLLLGTAEGMEQVVERLAALLELSEIGPDELPRASALSEEEAVGD
ncbi:hypothetical protein CFIO01_07876 [Colletotrichum fioriniae PJ7]|uniref:Uncharacterized protein n=1 Tax=Colletotrichum fioriniae PJ7 TaxID=1445577 RepID=A0A010R6L9_9PEZI|nr:hypothetical protein CFIO01_07876 [Colletotrichum fioriniae PJ7]